MARTHDPATTSPGEAVRWLRTWFGFTVPAELEDLALRAGLDHELVSLPPQVIGCLIHEGGDRHVILVNRKLSTPHRRLALAHELGHWIMHQHTAPIFVCNLNLSDHREHEAELFSRLLLGDSLVP